MPSLSVSALLFLLIGDSIQGPCLSIYGVQLSCLGGLHSHSNYKLSEFIGGLIHQLHLFSFTLVTVVFHLMLYSTKVFSCRSFEFVNCMSQLWTCCTRLFMYFQPCFIHLTNGGFKQTLDSLCKLWNTVFIMFFLMTMT